MKRLRNTSIANNALRRGKPLSPLVILENFRRGCDVDGTGLFVWGPAVAYLLTIACTPTQEFHCEVVEVQCFCSLRSGGTLFHQRSMPAEQPQPPTYNARHERTYGQDCSKQVQGKVKSTVSNHLQYGSLRSWSTKSSKHKQSRQRAPANGLGPFSCPELATFARSLINISTLDSVRSPCS